MRLTRRCCVLVQVHPVKLSNMPVVVDDGSPPGRSYSDGLKSCRLRISFRREADVWLRTIVIGAARLIVEPLLLVDATLNRMIGGAGQASRRICPRPTAPPRPPTLSWAR